MQVLKLAQEMKLLKVCLDGTKIHANASKHQALSHGHIEQMERQMKTEVQELFALAEQADQSAIPEGVNLPDGVGQAFELNVPSLQAATRSIKFRTLRPRRSSFQTTSVSPARRSPSA